MIHCCVSTCIIQVYEFTPASATSPTMFVPKPDLSESFVLLPREVPSTSARGVGATLVHNVETFLFNGQSFSDLAGLRQITVLVVCLVSDSASARILMQEYLKVMCLADMQSEALLLFCWERCGLHQLVRTAISLAHRYGSVSPLYSFGNFFQMKRFQVAVRRAIHRVVDAQLLWEPFLEPPEQREAFQCFRDLLLDSDLLLHR